jgi:hypothetical protein
MLCWMLVAGEGAVGDVAPGTGVGRGGETTAEKGVASDEGRPRKM